MTGAGWRRGAAALGLLAAALGLAWLAGASRGAVDWRAARAVVIESDDWGLCGFLPDGAAAGDAERSAWRAEVAPPVYWDSTLEDSAAVAALAAVLAECRGRDGLAPVLQANMIVSALSPPVGPGPLTADAAWTRHDVPDRPAAYARPGLETAVDAAIDRGVWRPELHGSFHYDPDRRRAAVAADPLALAAARRGVLPFPGSATAWELGPQRPPAALAAELDRALELFARRFGRRPSSVCAPDYVWDGRSERLWQARGLTVIQAKREQRSPLWPSGRLDHRARKVLARAWDRLAHLGRAYLDRNVRFEPAQAPGDSALVARTLAAIGAAWRRGEPAVVESHRINYVRLTPGAAAAGRRQLGSLLAALTRETANAPLFLTDDEVAQLQAGGTSWTRRGDRLVVRNLTRSLRLVTIPAQGERGRDITHSAAVSCIAVPPRRTLVAPWPGDDRPDGPNCPEAKDFARDDPAD